jgi:hypothetical protein
VSILLPLANKFVCPSQCYYRLHKFAKYNVGVASNKIILTLNFMKWSVGSKVEREGTHAHMCMHTKRKERESMLITQAWILSLRRKNWIKNYLHIICKYVYLCTKMQMPSSSGSLVIAT